MATGFRRAAPSEARHRNRGSRAVGADKVEEQRAAIRRVTIRHDDLIVTKAVFGPRCCNGDIPILTPAVVWVPTERPHDNVDVVLARKAKINELLERRTFR